jgi:hypothetical protein
VKEELEWLHSIAILITFKWDKFSEFVLEKLPSYAQPVFVRIIEELETTGTFKLKKNEFKRRSLSP